MRTFRIIELEYAVLSPILVYEPIFRFIRLVQKVKAIGILFLSQSLGFLFVPIGCLKFIGLFINDLAHELRENFLNQLMANILLFYLAQIFHTHVQQLLLI